MTDTAETNNKTRDKRRKNDTKDDTSSNVLIANDLTDIMQDASLNMMVGNCSSSTPTPANSIPIMNTTNSAISTPSLPHVSEVDLQHIMNNIYSGGPQVSSINVMGDFIRQTLYDYHKTVSFVIAQAIQDRRINIKNVLDLMEEQQSLQSSQLMFLTSVQNLQEKLNIHFNDTSRETQDESI